MYLRKGIFLILIITVMTAIFTEVFIQVTNLFIKIYFIIKSQLCPAGNGPEVEPCPARLILKFLKSKYHLFYRMPLI